MKFARILFSGVAAAVLAITALASCGPEESRTQAVEDQQRENYQKARADLAPALGTYIGLLKNNSDQKKSFNATLTIKHKDIWITDSTTGKMQKIPTLEGNLVKLSENKDADESDLTVGLYDKGDYDGVTGEFRLSSQVTTKEGSGEFSIAGILSGDLISATVNTPYKKGMSFEGTREK